MSNPVEISWFGALCDDDYEFLGVPNPDLVSSWNHCQQIVQTADRNGFDNVLLPSGYQLGIDSTAFAAAIAMSRDLHYYSSTRAEKELGYAVRPLETTVDDAWSWLVEHGASPNEARG